MSLRIIFCTFIVGGFSLIVGCNTPKHAAISSRNVSKAHLTDDKATAETKALFYNLLQLSKSHTLFGHQHATEYGHGWAGDSDRSDVKSVTGSHPAVIGVDLSGFTGQSEQAVQRAKTEVRNTVVNTYNRGGLVTVAWHFSNPV